MSKNLRVIMCKINEISGDLFSSRADSSLAHCVAADMRLGKGIAVRFRDKFGQIQNLKSQNARPGEIAVIQDNNRSIYYLVTKQLSYQKPTYKTMFESLTHMKDHMSKNNVTKLAIPRIGCGLDGLDWNKVKDLIQEVFENDDVEITVYNYVPPKK